MNLTAPTPGRRSVRQCRADGYGGVFVACSESLVSSSLETGDTSCELVACQICLANNPTLIICSMYRSPSSNDQYLDNLCNQLETIIKSHPNSAIWLSGDLNLPDINWCDNCVDGHNYHLNTNHIFLDFLNNNGLTQIVDFPTRGTNTLDIFITNRPSLIDMCIPIDGISDHEAILTKSSVRVQLCHPAKRPIYLWSKTDFNEIRHTILPLCNEFVSTYSAATPINVLWNKFSDICIQCLNLIPTKMSSSKLHQPWITNQIKRLSRKKQRLYNRARLTNHPNDWSSYYEIKRLCQRECRNTYNDYVSRLVDPDNNAITKKLWSFIKSKKQDQTGIGTLKYQGKDHTDSLSKANILNEYFSSVFTNEDITNIPTLEGNPFPEISPIYISPAGVAQLLHNLKPHKAAGPDRLPSRFLKEVANEIAPPLSLIFQASLNQGAPPVVWKSAMVVPVFKKGSRSNPSNYRPVSLTCICSKIFEHIIYSCLSNHLETYHILQDQQHGFRHHRSCETQLITTIHDLAQSLNHGGQCDVMLLDFCKAFDKVPHLRLFYKLHHYGIRGSVLTWITDFLTDRSQRVILDNKESNPCSVLSGVPQGTVLAPLLFLIYINDLPLHVSNKVRLYADDVILYSHIHSVNDCHNLQQDLDKLTEWSHKWQMIFNPKKCEFLRITNKKNPIPHTYYIDNCQIDEVSNAKYLGVVIDQHLTWNEHIKQTTSKAIRVNGFLYRNLYHCPITVKLNCYKAMVRPIIEYASPVWDPHTSLYINHLEAVQRSAARFCCKDYSRFSSVTSMLSSLNLPSLRDRRIRAKLLMMYKIIHQLVCIPDDFLAPKYPSLRRGYFTQPDTRVDCFKFSFFPSTIKLWNSLPPYVINSPTCSQFCTNLDNYHNLSCAL